MVDQLTLHGNRIKERAFPGAWLSDSRAFEGLQVNKIRFAAGVKLYTCMYSEKNDQS